MSPTLSEAPSTRPVPDLAQEVNTALAAEAAIPGWLKTIEAVELFRLAHNTPDDHPVCCEIGSWLGKSSVIFAIALRPKTGAKLYCVDPFDLVRDEAWHIETLREQVGDTDLSRMELFRKHVRDNNVEQIVVPVEGYSYQVIKSFKKPLDLLFIDGAHDYEGVLQDFIAWSPLVKPGGMIAFHDYHADPDPEIKEHEGPKKVIDDWVLSNPDWVDHRVVGSLFIASRRRPDVPEAATAPRANGLHKSALAQSLPTGLARLLGRSPVPTGEAPETENTTASEPGMVGDYQIAWEPDLIPPRHLMAQEGHHVLEEWFRWAEEWSLLLRVYGGITKNSAVLEIGAGLGRIAFPLRYILKDGTYDGFEIRRDKVEWLQETFSQKYPNFRFTLANIHNTHYNPEGQIRAIDYRFPYPYNAFDTIYAASVFTHLLPDAAENYIREASWVLKPGGRCLFSFFLLDNYRPGEPRPQGFADPIFNVDHPFGAYGNEFAVSDPDNPEHIAAYSLRLIERFATQAGLELAQAPVPGLWSGSVSPWISTQDLVILRKP